MFSRRKTERKGSGTFSPTRAAESGQVRYHLERLPRGSTIRVSGGRNKQFSTYFLKISDLREKGFKMKTVTASKRAIAVLMAILMIAAVSTVSVFAAITPGEYFYQYINNEYQPTPMGSDTVRSYIYDSVADLYYVDFKVMSYTPYPGAPEYIGYIDTLTVDDGSLSGASIVITDAFRQYLDNAPIGVNMNTYLKAYTGTTHTLVYSATTYGMPLPISAISFTIYDPDGNLYPHPALVNPYIALQ
jgi:hypothetical protein